MKRIVKKIIMNIYKVLPAGMQIEIANHVKSDKYKYFLEDIRLNNYFWNTDFEKIDASDYPPCNICKAAWDYPIFHMYFLINMLDNIVYCLSKGMKPVIQFKNSKDGINIWEQFLEQPFEVRAETYGGVECDISDVDLHWPVIPTREEISKFGSLYTSFVRLNSQTKEYFDAEYEAILKGKRVLGVLCRGTDYTANKPAGHPVQPEVVDVIELAKIKKKELSCDYIYLATEEKLIYEKFEDTFPEQVLVNKRRYYDEFYEMKKREGLDARISMVHFEREHDSYYKSLEYFSSVNLLSKCVALVAGNCGGSRAALYLNQNNYEYWHLFDLGLYE